MILLILLGNNLETTSAICCACEDPPEDPVVTMRGHVFCYQCVSDYLNGDGNTCSAPGCKAALAEDAVFSKATLKSCLCDELCGSNSIKVHDFAHSLVQQSEYTSYKIKAVLETLHSNCKLNSRSSGLLNSAESHRVEASLQQSPIQYRRLDATMSLIARDISVKDFNTDPEVTVMLMSLKAGNLGLNIVALKTEYWFFRKRRKMVASTFGDDNSDSRLSVDDLKYLFGVDS
ncbi:hypothetical protein S245_031386 [Arachis hypogaea]